MSDEHNGDGPVFDFTRFSWKDAKRAQLMQFEARHASALMNNPDVLGNQQAFDDAVDRIGRVTAELARMNATVIVSVPRDWLIADAPENLDWSDPDSQDWLQFPRMEELQQAMVEARQPESVTKN